MPLLPSINQLLIVFSGLALLLGIDRKATPLQSISEVYHGQVNAAAIDVCKDGPFHKLLSSPGDKSIAINDMIQEVDGSFIIAGSIDNNISNVDALVMKTDAMANPLWQRSFDLGTNDMWIRIRKTSNGNYLLAGQSISDILVMEIDANGNTLWSKKISDTKIALYDMLLDTDGSILLAGNRFNDVDEPSAYFIKLDSRGNKNWALIYDNPGSDLFLDIAQDAGGYYVSGNSRTAPSNALLVKIDRNNGSINWAYQYDINNRFDVFQQLHIVNNKLLVNGYSRASVPPIYNRQINAVIDTDGSVSNLKMFGNNIFDSDVLMNADGSYLVVQSNYKAEPYLNIYKFEQDNSFSWGSKKFTDVNRGFSLIGHSSQGGYFLSSIQRSSASGAAYLLNVDENGFVPGCEDSMVSETVTTMSMSRIAFNYTSISDQPIIIEDLSWAGSIENITSTDYCSSTCEQFKIEGQSFACTGNNPAIYSIKRNPGCDLPVTWSFNEEMATIVNRTDTSIELRFVDIGTFELTASIATPCAIISDKLNININVSLPAVNLSKDHHLCKGDYVSLFLPGYKTYLWSTGETGNTITVNQAGTYYVTVEDYCGNLSSDTIDFTFANGAAVELGPDKTVCSYQPIELDAGPGYRTYLWQNGLTSRKIKVNTPGVYSVMVTNETGCKAYDTLIVKEGECFQGISFPNAFSPNNDGKNDLFKPAIYAFPEYYELVIYNRWGQIVFQSKEKEKGWDGKINGFIQDQQNFTYFCRFKFPGSEMQVKRGSFLLIK